MDEKIQILQKKIKALKHELTTLEAEANEVFGSQYWIYFWAVRIIQDLLFP